MSARLHVREAVRADAPAIADIGRRAMAAQYAGLVGRTAAQAAIEQSYAVDAVEACIERCRTSNDAYFLVAEQLAVVIGFCTLTRSDPSPSCTGYTSIAKREAPVQAAR